MISGDTFASGEAGPSPDTYGNLALPIALCFMAFLFGACAHPVHQHDQGSQVEENPQEEEEPDCCSLQLPGE